MDDAFGAADRFLLKEARLLERRLFATCFLGQPASLPICVETAFEALATAGTVDHDMVIRACDFLDRAAGEADAGGAVPLAFPVIESFPRARRRCRSHPPAGPRRRRGRLPARTRPTVRERPTPTTQSTPAVT